MKKVTFRQGLAIALVTLVAFSCQDESLKPTDATLKDNALNTSPAIDKIIIRRCPDLIVNSVISYGVTGNVVNYGVAIKNIGSATANINYTTNHVYWQAYLSKDGITKNLAACGQSFSAIALAPNQITWNSINCTFPASVNLYEYTSMIVELHVAAAVGECNSANNSFVRTPPPY